jgi:hypothetical protein
VSPVPNPWVGSSFQSMGESLRVQFPTHW